MDNNTSSNPPPPLGHVDSPLFTVLPFDVRLIIYREFFSGSKQEVVSRPDREDPNNHLTASNRLCLPLNRQFNLVRACKEIYKESRHVYWKETAIKLAYRPLRANLTAIPSYARQRIRALEGVPLADALSAMNQIPLDQFLAIFPRLDYCQFQRLTVYMDCHSNEISINELVEKSGSDAFRELALLQNIKKPPVFVQRIYLRPTKDHGRVVWVYANHTRGRFFVTRIGSVSDEEGFERVTGPEEIQKADEAGDPDAVRDANDAHEGDEVDDENNSHETSMTDDAAEVNDNEADDVSEEDKLNWLVDTSEGNNEDE